MRAGGSRRTVDHLADFAGRVLRRRADRAGHGARGVERAICRRLKGEGAGRSLGCALNCRGDLAAVEQDIGVVLAERQRNVGRLGNRDGEHLFSGILLRADGRLSLDGDLTASLGRRGDGGAAVGADFAGKLDNILVARGPCDRIGLAGHIGQLSVDILLRHAGDGERLAGLYRSRFEGDLNVVLTSDGDACLAGFRVLAVARRDAAVEHISTRAGDILLDIAQNRTHGAGLGRRIGIDCTVCTVRLVAVHVPDHGFDRTRRNRRCHGQIGNGVRDLIGRVCGLLREGNVGEGHLSVRRNACAVRVFSVVEEFLRSRLEAVERILELLAAVRAVYDFCRLDRQLVDHHFVSVDAGLNLDLGRFLFEHSFELGVRHLADRLTDARLFGDLVCTTLIDRNIIGCGNIAVDLRGDRRRAGCDRLDLRGRRILVRIRFTYLCNSGRGTCPLDAGVRIFPIRFTVKQRVGRLDARGHFECTADHRGNHSGLVIAVLQAEDHRAVVQQCLQTGSLPVIRHALAVHDFERCNRHTLILDADRADSIRTNKFSFLGILICLASIVACNADIDVRRVASLVRLHRCRSRSGVGSDIQTVVLAVIQIQQLRLRRAGIAGHLRLKRAARAHRFQRKRLLRVRQRDRDGSRAADPEADLLRCSRRRGRLHIVIALVIDLRRQRCAADASRCNSRFNLIGRIVADCTCGDLRAVRRNRDGIAIAGKMNFAVCQIACGHAAAADRDSRGERSGVALIQRNRAVDITVAERQREGICVPHINREILRMGSAICQCTGSRDPDGRVAGLFAGHDRLCFAAADSCDCRDALITGFPVCHSKACDRRLDLDRRVRLDAVRLICSQCRRNHRQYHGEHQQQAHESSKCTLHTCTSFNLQPIAAADFM